MDKFLLRLSILSFIIDIIAALASEELALDTAPERAMLITQGARHRFWTGAGAGPADECDGRLAWASGSR
jgi:hypothetical protein